MNVSKLLSEYRDKIIACDAVIKIKTDQIRSIRKIEGWTSEDYIEQTAPYVEDRKIANTQRQCYVQFMADLEGLSGNDEWEIPQEEGERLMINR